MELILEFFTSRRKLKAEKKGCCDNHTLRFVINNLAGLFDNLELEN